MSGLVLAGGWVLQSADRCHAADLRIEAGRIQAIGRDVAQPFDDVRNVSGKLVAPGLVQAHVHLCQTLFRGLADDMELLDWLNLRIRPLEAAADEESTEIAALVGAVELIRGGTTCVADFGPMRHARAIVRAMERAGLRGQVGKCLMDQGDPRGRLQEDMDSALAEAQALADELAGHPLLRYAVMPRGIRSASDDLLRAAGTLARRRGLPLQIHAAESSAEVELVLSERGHRPVALLDRLELLGPHTQLAHCVWTDPGERQRLAESKTSVVHCPGSNLKLASGLAPIPDYLARGINVALGADGAPCNNTLDAFMEMRLAALIHKPAYGPRAMPAHAVFTCATEGGACALDWGGEVGRLDVGWRADVLVVDLQGAHLAPATSEPDAAWAVGRLVYAARASDVDSLFVDGRPLMWRREVLTLDESAIREAAADQMRRLAPVALGT